MILKVNGEFFQYAKRGKFWGGQVNRDSVYNSRDLAGLEGKIISYTDRHYTTRITLEFLSTHSIKYSERSLSRNAKDIVDGKIVYINTTNFVSSEGILAQVFYFNPPNRFNSGMPARTHFTYNKETGIITFLLTHVDEEVVKELV